MIIFENRKIVDKVELPEVETKEQNARDEVHLWITNSEYMYNRCLKVVRMRGIERAAEHLFRSWRGDRTGDGCKYTKNRIMYALTCDFPDTFASGVAQIAHFLKENEATIQANNLETARSIYRWFERDSTYSVGKDNIPLSYENISWARTLLMEEKCVKAAEKPTIYWKAKNNSSFMTGYETATSMRAAVTAAKSYVRNTLYGEGWVYYFTEKPNEFSAPDRTDECSIHTKFKWVTVRK